MRGTIGRKLGAAVGATTLASAGLLVATASPAAAAPTGCSSTTNYAHSSAISYCSGGSGTHQAVAVCTGGDLVFGPRVRAGHESWALCDRWDQPPTEWWVSSHSYWVYNS